MLARGAAVALAALLVLGSGCITRERGDGRNGEEASLNYAGRALGTHDTSVWCDGSAQVTVGATLHVGSVEARLEDADGRVVWQGTFSPATRADAANVNGTAGLWELHAERKGTAADPPFSGSYGIRVAC